MSNCSFGSVGKSVLIRALGISQNYTAKSDKLDRKATGCFKCPHYLEMQKHKKDKNNTSYVFAERQCLSCPSRVYGNVRVNEKNRYGQGYPLKSNAMKLFLYLHLCNPRSETGVICGFHIATAADYLHCSERSIRNNLALLQEHNYITYEADFYRGYYIITLLEYPKYFETARSGGRGYFVLSSTLLTELIKIQDINQLRIYLREYLNIDAKKKQTNLVDIHDKRYTDIRSLHELRRYLPSYLKPGKIKHILDRENRIFDISGNGQYQFSLNAVYFGEEEKKHVLNQYKAKLDDHISLINSYLDYRNTDVHTKIMGNPIDGDKNPQYLDCLIRKFLIEPYDRPGSADHPEPFISLTDKDIDDIAQLCLEYSYDTVLDIIHQLWVSGTMGKLQTNYGAYIRTSLKEAA